MVWVLPATAAGAVRTVAGAAVALAAGEPLAEAAVMPPPTASTARPIPAMMIFGCRMVISSEVDCLLTTNTDSRDWRFTRQAGYAGGLAGGGGAGELPAGRDAGGGAGGVDEGAAGGEGVDLVDEHDRRRAGAGLLEQVPDPAAPRPTNISTKLEPD